MTASALLTAVKTAPDHRWLDRIVRGRAWIPVLGALLTVVVAMQVEVLKLGASVGRNVSLVAALQSRNEMLRTQVAQLSATSRIIDRADSLGMRMPGPVDDHFVTAAGGAVSAAIAGIHAPNPAAFLATLASDQQADSTVSVSATSGDTSAAGTASGGDAGATVSSAAQTPDAAAGTTGGSETETAPGPSATADTSGAVDGATSDDTGSTDGAGAASGGTGLGQ